MEHMKFKYSSLTTSLIILRTEIYFPYNELMRIFFFLLSIYYV